MALALARDPAVVAIMGISVAGCVSCWVRRWSSSASARDPGPGSEGLAVVTSNASFAVAKDMVFGSEDWFVALVREAYAGGAANLICPDEGDPFPAHLAETMPAEHHAAVAEWRISPAAVNWARGLAAFAHDAGRLDLVALQEPNASPRFALPARGIRPGAAGFGATTAAVAYLSSLAEQPLAYVRTERDYGPAHLAVAYNARTLGAPILVAEGECSPHLEAGRPFLALHFPARQLLVVNVHAARLATLNPKEVYVDMFARIEEAVRAALPLCEELRIVVCGDFNDEAGTALDSSAVAETGLSYLIDRSYRFLGKALTLPGAWADLDKTSPLPEYSEQGLMANCTIDYVLDSMGHLHTQSTGFYGVPAAMDYTAALRRVFGDFEPLPGKWCDLYAAAQARLEPAELRARLQQLRLHSDHMPVASVTAALPAPAPAPSAK